MNKKFCSAAACLELCGVLLLLFSALRADGGLGFWLTPALTGIGLCLAGLGLAWLCSPEGLTFRRRTFGTVKRAPAPLPPSVIPFPKAG